jgi:phage regulator Rha-like protein
VNNIQKTKEIMIPDERIIGKIYYVRGEKVMFDRDLAALYGVETKELNKAVKRNTKRFPADFMFQLNKEEANMFLRFQFGTLDKSLKSQIVTSSFDNKSLRSQIVTLEKGQGRGKYSKYLPYAFTEQGVAMLSSVLHSDRAVQVNIQIMRTFTQMRKMLMTHKDLREKIEKMERKYDQRFQVVFEVIKRFLKTDPKKDDMKITGFKSGK